MSIATVEEEIVDRGGSRGFYRLTFQKPVSFTKTGIISQYILIKWSRFMDNILVTFFIRSIYMFIFIYQRWM